MNLLYWLVTAYSTNTSSVVQESHSGGSAVSQQVKALASEPDEWSLMPSASMVEGENQFPQVVL